MADNNLLLFVIPVRHHNGVQDWAAVNLRLAATLQSILAQTSTYWRCAVVADHETPLPRMPSSQFDVIRDHLPGLGASVRAPDISSQRKAVRRDKGKRVLTGLTAIDEFQYFMVVDYDDLVSRHLSTTTIETAETGWVFTHGYAWGGGRWCLRLDDFHLRCGSSAILARSLLPLEEMQLIPDHPLTIRWLGSHMYSASDLESQGRPLQDLPYPGAVYRIGHGGNDSRIGPLRNTYFSLGRTMKQPLKMVRRATSLRPSSALIDDFSLPM